MFKVVGCISFMFGFLVPYISAPEVTTAWGITLQVLFYANGVYYIFVLED